MNTNKADRFRLGGSYCTAFVMFLCAEFLEFPEFEHMGLYAELRWGKVLAPVG